jgi:hydrogenase maturation protease
VTGGSRESGRSDAGVARERAGGGDDLGNGDVGRDHEETSHAPCIAVIGLGNVLLGDDGFGPTVVELLRAGWDLGDDVEVIDAGTPSLDLAGYLDGRERVILVDTVAADGEPGELRGYRGEELAALPMKPRTSPHDPAVQEALAIVDFAGNGPRDVVLVGTIPATTEVGTVLSPAVVAAIDSAIGLVVAELLRSGVDAVRRAQPRRCDAWWLNGTLRAAP